MKYNNNGIKEYARNCRNTLAELDHLKQVLRDQAADYMFSQQVGSLSERLANQKDTWVLLYKELSKGVDDMRTILKAIETVANNFEIEDQAYVRDHPGSIEEKEEIVDDEDG